MAPSSSLTSIAPTTIGSVAPWAGGMPATANLLPIQGSMSLSYDSPGHIGPSTLSKNVLRMSVSASVTPDASLNAGKWLRKRSALIFCSADGSRSTPT